MNFRFLLFDTLFRLQKADVYKKRMFTKSGCLQKADVYKKRMFTKSGCLQSAEVYKVRKFSQNVGNKKAQSNRSRPLFVGL
ncbi:hypothetical protein CGSMWGv00703Bmash_05147 [Gardnerella pickettii 00703Bmash]|nr:hypothetical protein CGSMWGv00703Bmash_05147 [Gardnerella pickettii 00703Bmash]